MFAADPRVTECGAIKVRGAQQHSIMNDDALVDARPAGSPAAGWMKLHVVYLGRGCGRNGPGKNGCPNWSAMRATKRCGADSWRAAHCRNWFLQWLERSGRCRGGKPAGRIAVDKRHRDVAGDLDEASGPQAEQSWSLIRVAMGRRCRDAGTRGYAFRWRPLCRGDSGRTAGFCPRLHHAVWSSGERSISRASVRW